MEYKLFEEFITLQALLKELGIIQSGGAIKAFLIEHQVYFNDKNEMRLLSTSIQKWDLPQKACKKEEPI